MTINNQLILNEVQDYVGITRALILYSFGFTFFLMPYEIVTGGVAGIAAIVYYATHFPNSYTYFLVNAALLIVGLKILGWRFLVKTIYAILMLTFLLGLMKELAPVTPTGEMHKILGEGQDFMSLVIGCLMTGTALGLVFLFNGSTGGTDIIAASINKYKPWSLGTVLIFVDFVIIGSCFFIPQFGETLNRIKMCVFGFCTMIIEQMAGDSQCPWYTDRARRDHPRRPWLVHWQRAQGDLSAGTQAREQLHLPSHQDHRPQCICQPEPRHRCLRRGLRPDKSAVVIRDNPWNKQKIRTFRKTITPCKK